jgi:hypothetical protein
MLYVIWRVAAAAVVAEALLQVLTFTGSDNAVVVASVNAIYFNAEYNGAGGAS